MKSRPRSRDAFTLTELMLFMVIGLMMLALMIDLTVGENRLDRWTEARLDAVSHFSLTLEQMRRDAAVATGSPEKPAGARWSLQLQSGAVNYQWSGPRQPLVRSADRTQNLGPLEHFDVEDGSVLVSVKLGAVSSAVSRATTASACFYVRQQGLKLAYQPWVADMRELQAR